MRVPRTLGFAAMAAHPNIEVRLFNPFASRSGGLRFVGEGLPASGASTAACTTRRWIADNRIAIAGGRNLGDEYFGASEEVNFVDLDFAMVGTGRARRVGIVRPVLEFAVGVSDGDARSGRGQHRGARQAARSAGAHDPRRRRSGRYAERPAQRRRRAAPDRRRLADAMVVELSRSCPTTRSRSP